MSYGNNNRGERKSLPARYRKGEKRIWHKKQRQASKLRAKAALDNN